jgi:hypothetical protein
MAAGGLKRSRLMLLLKNLVILSRSGAQKNIRELHFCRQSPTVKILTKNDT